jgi:adenylylsulfate kinase-like enzyme
MDDDGESESRAKAEKPQGRLPIRRLGQLADRLLMRGVVTVVSVVSRYLSAEKFAVARNPPKTLKLRVVSLAIEPSIGNC